MHVLVSRIFTICVCILLTQRFNIEVFTECFVEKPFGHTLIHFQDKIKSPSRCYHVQHDNSDVVFMYGIIKAYRMTSHFQNVPVFQTLIVFMQFMALVTCYRKFCTIDSSCHQNNKCSNYRKFPKYSNTQKMCCNHPKS